MKVFGTNNLRTTRKPIFRTNRKLKKSVDTITINRSHQQIILKGQERINQENELWKQRESPSRQNCLIVNSIVQEVEVRVQHIISLTEEDEEVIAIPISIIKENIEENILNLEIPEETQQINLNNLKQLSTINRQQLAVLITAMTIAINNN
ncbi:hypothetical protein Glove_130g112 [Diversispora epigaea]|uniref:Uncharacterized protein n=1 Tax=Diversispora epigaea TaxID=1348612 RepID=A0A397J7Z5_9GLOM|nr:hypothetical protein Glove_130g112 [Diversispora epigaea]